MLKQTSNNTEIEYDCWLQEQIDCLKSNLSSDRFPEICPYTLEDLIDENDKW